MTGRKISGGTRPEQGNETQLALSSLIRRRAVLRRFRLQTPDKAYKTRKRPYVKTVAIPAPGPNPLFPPTFKAKVALEAVKGEETVGNRPAGTRSTPARYRLGRKP